MTTARNKPSCHSCHGLTKVMASRSKPTSRLLVISGPVFNIGLHASHHLGVVVRRRSFLPGRQRASQGKEGTPTGATLHSGQCQADQNPWSATTMPVR